MMVQKKCFWLAREQKETRAPEARNELGVLDPSPRGYSLRPMRSFRRFAAFVQG